MGDPNMFQRLDTLKTPFFKVLIIIGLVLLFQHGHFAAAASISLLGFVFYVCLFLWTPSFEGNWVSLMGFSLMSGTGVDGNAPYQAQELQITTLANPGIQTNFLPPRPVQS